MTRMKCAPWKLVLGGGRDPEICVTEPARFNELGNIQFFFAG